MTSAHREGWAAGTGDGAEEPRVVIRDRRRIDPDSGEVRPQPDSGGGRPEPDSGEVRPHAAGSDATSAAAAAAKATATAAATAAAEATAGVPFAAAEPSAEAEVAANLREQIAERTSDLQRLKAEFDNYRRRVERDRQVSADAATGRLLASLLPTLDDIARARDHGDLEGPFKTVAESLEVTLEGAGLERFGSAGEPFDPVVHDALMHTYRPDVSEATCVEVFRSGYRHAGRVLRPAQVTVAEPPPAAEAEPDVGDAPPDLSEQTYPSAQTHSSAWADSAAPDDTGSIPPVSNGDETVSAE